MVELARSLVPVALGALLLLPITGSAQDPPEESPSDTVPLVFEREIFHYPEFERRNPFQPLTGDLDGPRFEELRLLGIIASSDPSRSVALLGLTGGDGSQAYRVRTGEVVGNVRVMEIQPSRIMVEVEEFGVREQRIMELRRATDPAPQQLFRPREPVEPPVDTLEAAPGDPEPPEPPEPDTPPDGDPPPGGADPTQGGLS